MEVSVRGDIRVLFRIHRRLSILPEVNEDLDVLSPVEDRSNGYELMSRFRGSCWTDCGRLSSDITDQSADSLDNHLAHQSNGRKPRQHSDSFMILKTKGRS